MLPLARLFATTFKIRLILIRHSMKVCRPVIKQHFAKFAAERRQASRVGRQGAFKRVLRVEQLEAECP
jgi:hypothetical protein